MNEGSAALDDQDREERDPDHDADPTFEVVRVTLVADDGDRLRAFGAMAGESLHEGVATHGGRGETTARSRVFPIFLPSFSPKNRNAFGPRAISTDLLETPYSAMDTREIEVVCPCCNQRLRIDVRTERVMRSSAPKVLDEAGKPKVEEKDWDQALSKVKGREAQGADKLDAFLDGERGKAKRLEDKFHEAQKKLKKPDAE